MISKISLRIARILIKHSAIENEDEELYTYGFFILLSQILYFVITVAIGIVFNIIIESIVFYIAFLFIRKYAGGYHASTEARCEILTSLSIVVCLFVIKLSEIYNIQIPLLIISYLSAVCIFALCPLDTPEKPLNEKERKHFRLISRIILFIICILITISFCFKLSFAFTALCMSLILESVLLSSGKIKKYIYKENAY